MFQNATATIPVSLLHLSAALARVDAPDCQEASATRLLHYWPNEIWDQRPRNYDHVASERPLSFSQGARLDRPHGMEALVSHRESCRTPCTYPWRCTVCAC